MFEINLVPDVKEQLLKKQKMRNFVIFVSIVVASGAAAVTVLLGMVVMGQNIHMDNQDHEIVCRSEGSGGKNECSSKFGTAVLKFESLNEFLTIQDQMSKISALNNGKLLLSRVFGVLTVILPFNDDDKIEVYELGVNLPNGTLTFDAQGTSSNKINYRALLVFKDLVKLSYYDYGSYMRFDKEANEFVKIPSYCIDEPEIDLDARELIYGVYRKGAPGCEAPVLALDKEEDVVGEEVGGEGVVENIRIERVYRTLKDKEEYKKKENVDGGLYYFESQCISYGDDGRVDEKAVRKLCPLAEGEPLIRDSSNGRNAEGSLMLRFSAVVTINREVFRFTNKHMLVVGPTRQNVTDSYKQIRNIFAERAADCRDDDEECRSQEQRIPDGN